MADHPKYRRRTIIVDPEMQKRLLRSITMIPVLGMLVANGAVALLAGRVIAEADAQSVDLPSLGPLFGSILLLCFCTVALMVLQGIRLGHRVAGPQLRLRRVIREIQEGKFDQDVRLREHDELKGLATELNGLMAWLRQHPPQGIEIRSSEPAEAAPEAAREEEPVLAGH